MSEITDRSSYQIPSSVLPEIVSVGEIPESPEVRAWRAKQEAELVAESIHRVDPTDTDPKRTETVGAVAYLATREEASLPVATEIDPAEILGYGIRVGELLEFYRQRAQQSVAEEHDGK